MDTQGIAPIELNGSRGRYGISQTLSFSAVTIRQNENAASCAAFGVHSRRLGGTVFNTKRKGNAKKSEEAERHKEELE